MAAQNNGYHMQICLLLFTKLNKFIYQHQTSLYFYFLVTGATTTTFTKKTHEDAFHIEKPSHLVKYASRLKILVVFGTIQEKEFVNVSRYHCHAPPLHLCANCISNRVTEHVLSLPACLPASLSALCQVHP